MAKIVDVVISSTSDWPQIERMPPGCPVITCGIGQIGLRNAAIAAVQMLAVCNDDLVSTEMRKALRAYLGANNKPAQIDYRLSLHKKEVKKSE